jgi:hypothetical protein
MADRNSAEIFSILFNKLASEYGSAVSASNGGHSINVAMQSIMRLAKEMWQETYHYDFSHSQLECDASLIMLGLARRSEGEIEYLDKDLETWR